MIPCFLCRVDVACSKRSDKCERGQASFDVKYRFLAFSFKICHDSDMTRAPSFDKEISLAFYPKEGSKPRFKIGVAIKVT